MGIIPSRKRGQGATEYLVLLAVVLVVAMVAIALLGFFPGMASDAKKTQSDAYWRSDARPFSVIEHSQSGSTLTLVLLNMEADQRSLRNVSIVGTGLSGANSTLAYFSAGEKKTRTVALGSACTSGDSYEYYVNFSYGTGDISSQVQYGAKPIIGKCT